LGEIDIMNVKWTEADKAFVKENAHSLKDQEIANALSERTGRKVSLEAVRKMRQKLGIKKKCGRGICGLIDREK